MVRVSNLNQQLASSTPSCTLAGWCLIGDCLWVGKPSHSVTQSQFSFAWVGAVTSSRNFTPCNALAPYLLPISITGVWLRAKETEINAAQEGLHLVYSLLYYPQTKNERQWMNYTGGGFCSADAGLGDQHSLPSPADDTGLSLYFLSGLSQLRRWAANFFFKARAISAAGSEQSNSTGSRCMRNGVPPGDLQRSFVTVSAVSLSLWIYLQY